MQWRQQFPISQNLAETSNFGDQWVRRVQAPGTGRSPWLMSVRQEQIADGAAGIYIFNTTVHHSLLLDAAFRPEVPPPLCQQQQERMSPGAKPTTADESIRRSLGGIGKLGLRGSAVRRFCPSAEGRFWPSPEWSTAKHLEGLPAGGQFGGNCRSAGNG